MAVGGNSSNQLPQVPSALTHVVTTSMTNAGTSSSQVMLPLGLALAGASGAMSAVSDAVTNQMLVRDLVQHEEADVQAALMEMVMGRHAPATAGAGVGSWPSAAPSSPGVYRAIGGPTSVGRRHPPQVSEVIL